MNRDEVVERFIDGLQHAFDEAEDFAGCTHPEYDFCQRVTIDLFYGPRVTSSDLDDIYQFLGQR